MTDHTGFATDRKLDNKVNKCVGIWRLLEHFHHGPWTDLYYAQPAEAAGSPRADYVVKMVTDTIDAQVEGQLQLRQEAACTKAVRHPNLIALLDARLSAPRPYVVFPRLEGQTLAAWLTQKYSQPVPVCLWWIRQAAQALQALHDAGWIHSDIKPENMLINLRGHLTLIDLGLARRSGETTSEDRYQGTPIYSAPEMFQSGGAAMPSGDVYSLGMVFYQTLAKTLPQETLRPLDFSILTKQGVTDSVVALIERMTHLRPQERPTACGLVDEIFKLEIETLGTHILPNEVDSQRDVA